MKIKRQATQKRAMAAKQDPAKQLKQEALMKQLQNREFVMDYVNDAFTGLAQGGKASRTKFLAQIRNVVDGYGSQLKPSQREKLEGHFRALAEDIQDFQDLVVVLDAFGMSLKAY